MPPGVNMGLLISRVFCSLTTLSQIIYMFFIPSPRVKVMGQSQLNSTQLKFITTLWSVDQIAQLITTHESRVHKMKNNEHEMSIAKYYT